MPVLLYKKSHQALHIVGVFAGCQRVQQGECHIKSGRRVVRGDDIVVDDDGLVRDDSDINRCKASYASGPRRQLRSIGWVTFCSGTERATRVLYSFDMRR